VDRLLVDKVYYDLEKPGSLPDIQALARYSG
jgi:hypothetical protein